MAAPPVSIARSKSLPCTDPDTGTTEHDVPVTALPDCRSESEKPLPDQLPDSVSFGPVAQASAALAPTVTANAQTARRVRRLGPEPLAAVLSRGVQDPATNIIALANGPGLSGEFRTIVTLPIDVSPGGRTTADAGTGASRVQRGAGRNRTGE